MDEIIHFRTKFSHATGIGNTGKMIPGRSSEACEIREMSIDDDARDIVWNKSTGTNIYTRNRYLQSPIDVTFVIGGGIFDSEKKHATDTIKKSVEKSCYFRGDRFTCIDLESNQSDYSNIKKSLVIILSSSINLDEYKKMGQLFSGNDVLFLMLFHPFEIEEVPYMLYESKSPGKRYYKEIQERISAIKKLLHSSSKSNILVRTDDNIVLKMNHFFKYRYG